MKMWQFLFCVFSIFVHVGTSVFLATVCNHLCNNFDLNDKNSNKNNSSTNCHLQLLKLLLYIANGYIMAHKFPNLKHVVNFRQDGTLFFAQLWCDVSVCLQHNQLVLKHNKANEDKYHNRTNFFEMSQFIYTSLQNHNKVQI